MDDRNFYRWKGHDVRVTARMHAPALWFYPRVEVSIDDKVVAGGGAWWGSNEKSESVELDGTQHTVTVTWATGRDYTSVWSDGEVPVLNYTLMIDDRVVGIGQIYPDYWPLRCVLPLVLVLVAAWAFLDFVGHDRDIAKDFLEWLEDIGGKSKKG